MILSLITIKQISINTILIHRSRRNDLLSLSYNEALNNLESGCWEYVANNVQYTEEL